MGACLTNAPPDVGGKQNTDAKPSEKQKLVNKSKNTNNIVPSDSDDEQDKPTKNNNTVTAATTKTNKKISNNPTIEQRLQKSVDKLDKSLKSTDNDAKVPEEIDDVGGGLVTKDDDKKDIDDDDNKDSTYINNIEFVTELTGNPPPASGSTNANSNVNDNQNHKNPLYNMLSTENLRYMIMDTILSQNSKFSSSDIVTKLMIKKLLIRWKTVNYCKLYLKLISSYKLNVDQFEINKNISVNRLAELYSIDRTLGRGAYAVVKLCYRRLDNHSFAVKIINKKGLNKWDLRGLKLEISIMRDLNHPNLVELFDVFESINKYGLIINLLSGGELLDVVIEKGNFSEKIASQCFVQLCDALNYIHSRGIAHRDLKPDNLLFKSRISPDVWDSGILPSDSLKLVDFGLAERCRKKKLTEYCGTPIYMAPEIFSHCEYRYECDMWSAGCILYILLVGYPPFDFNENHDINELSKSVLNDDIDFDPEYWSNISYNAKDLIIKLLCRNTQKRITAKQSLKHKWMKTASDKLFKDKQMDRLRKFNYVRKMRRGVTAMIAVIRLIEIFEWFTTTNNNNSPTASPTPDKTPKKLKIGDDDDSSSNDD